MALRLIIVLLSAVASATAFAVPPKGATAELANDQGEMRVRTTLLVDAATLTPGETFSAGVLVSLDPGWHVYWKNPGQAGLSTKLELVSAAADFDDVEWPTPVVFKEGDGLITTYGYADEVMLLTSGRVLDTEDKAVEITAQVDLLACEKSCIPGRATLRRVIPLGASTSPDTEATPVFARYRAQLPQPAAALGLSPEVVYSASAIRPGDLISASLILRCSEPGCKNLELAGEPAAAFVPDVIAGVELAASAAWRESERGDLVIKLDGRAGPDAVASNQTLAGVVKLQRAGESFGAEIGLPLPRAAARADVTEVTSPHLTAPTRGGAEPAGAGFLIQMLFFALLGGVVLNLMPCVLPVLFVKVAAVASLAHADKKTVLRHDMAYAAGVVGSMLALALAVVLLRKLGVVVGWGFQFQSPAFAIAVAVLLTLMALSMFGLFSVNVGAGWVSSEVMKSEGLSRSVLEGVLMVVVATPCTAPFLGTAVGFALTQSAPVVVLTFVAIGVGLAAPLVLVTLVPGVRRIVPKPGVWMEHMKQSLGFALLGAVLWLVWLIGRFAGTEGMTRTLAYLIIIAAAAWAFGVTQRHGRDGARRLALIAVLLVATVASPLLRFDDTAAAAPTTHAAGWQPYSPAAVSAATAGGRPAFVNFTADWCLTCKVFERTVLESDDVQRAFEDRNVALFVADWTRKDDTIRTELARYGKAGVPMWLVYHPGESQPVLLPEVVTPDDLVDALRRPLN